MKCPHCQHTADDKALLKCSQCGEAYERGPFEEFQHLEYLADWLADRPEINSSQKEQLLTIVENKQDALLAQLLPKHLESVLGEAQAVPTPVATPTPKPTPAARPKPVSPAPAPASIPTPVIAPPPKPTAPPKPQRPPVDWNKVRTQLADAVTSGALLRALLYLGAFMIVISATVLVIRFWNEFPPVLQMVFIASVPLIFYSGGWLLRSRLKLEQGGTVLTGIGAILVAVDFAAIYQLSGLAARVHGPSYWLGVALFCTALYAFTAWRMKGEFFDYLTLISGASILVALTRMPSSPPPLEWTVVTVTFAGMAMTILAGRYWKTSDTWHDLAKAARYLSQILIPASIFYVMFSLSDLPIMSAFLLAMVGYTILAWKFPSAVFAYSALIASIGMVIFGLRGMNVEPEWYALTASVLALIYLLLGQGLQKVKSVSNVIQNYVKALNITGFVLIATASVSGFFVAFFEVWAGVIAMTVATFDLIVCAYFFKRSWYTLFASSLFIVPFTFAFWQWFTDAQVVQSFGWLTVAWIGLSLAYIVIGALLRQSEDHARWLHLLAHGLTLFTLGVLPLEYSLNLRTWNYIPGSTALGASLFVYLISIFLHDSKQHPALSKLVDWIPFGFGKSIFIWFIGIIFPIWFAVGWRGNDLNELWLGALIAVFGIAYIGLGQWLVKRAIEYRLPLHVYSYILLPLGILFAIPNAYSFLMTERYPLLIALTITFISLALLAYIYNRFAETSLASVLFIWLFVLLLQMTKVPHAAYPFAFVLLAALVYIPVARVLDSATSLTKKYHAIPVFVIGYILSVYAIYDSILSSLNTTSIAWITILVPLIATGLYVFSAFYFKTQPLSHGWAWTSVVTFAITFRQTLTVFHSPIHYDAFAWIAFAALYMILSRVILNDRRNLKISPQNDIWLDRFRLPLTSGWITLSVLGLILSLPATLTAFSGIKLITYAPFIIAQAALVLLLIASAWMYRTRIPLYIEPFVAFLPTTLFCIGFGEKFFGKALTTPQFALAWMGLGFVHFIAAILVDKSKVRYAHGLYFGSYTLLFFALVFSGADRLVNIYVLAGTILIAIASHVLIHFGRHATYEDFTYTFFDAMDKTTRKIVSTIFAFYAAYATPVLLTQYLAHIELDLPWRGVTLAIAAPLYIAVSLLLGKTKPRTLPTAPTWATFSAGYALTAIGAMISFGDERLAIYVLALNAIVYAVSAYIFQQSFWLYLTTVLAPIVTLLTLHYNNKLETAIVAWTLIGFTAAYIALGQFFDRIHATRNTHASSPASPGSASAQREINPFAAAFYAPGFLMSAISLALASQDRLLAIQIYSAGVILYAVSSILFKETLFFYPAAWLATVPYYLAITLTYLETRWYGLAWLPLILVYIAIGRIFFHKEKLAPIGQGMLAQWLTHPAIPFYLLAYALSISMISLSYVSPLALTIAFGVAAILYFFSSYLFRKTAWIYPALFAIHMTVLAYFTINPSGGPMRFITLPFLAMTWLTSLIGYAFERTTPLTDENKSYRFSFLNRLFGHAWARPFFAFAIVEMIIWQSLALTGNDTAIIVASGHALLLALFSLLWTEGALVYGAVGFSLLAVGASLNQAEFKFPDAVAVYGGIGFGLYLFGRVLEFLSSRVKSLSVWLTPLTYWSIALTGAAVLLNLSALTTDMTAAAATFAFAGALYVAIAYRGRMYRLGYLGMALLEFAWVLALIINDVAQPQWYAIPGGLYFIGLAYLEWTHSKSKYAVALEILGLGVLLVTSFAQSLNGETGLPYFVLLLVEGLIVIWWGVYQKRKIPFFTGIGASAINIVAQVIVLVNVYDINRWLVAFGAGLLIMGFAIYIERSREQLRARARELSEALEKWE